MTHMRHIIGAALLGAMSAGPAAAIVMPAACSEANGAQYTQITTFGEGIAIGIVKPDADVRAFLPVLQSCSAARQIRITVPDEIGYERDVLDELHLIATSTESHTMQSIAARFADRGFPVQTLTGMRPTCLC